jgi:predicted HicB family RNase H-like nuclease
MKLQQLGDRLASKQPSQPASEPASKDTREQVMFRCSAETRKALKLLALQQDTTVQELLSQQVSKLLADRD